MRRTKRFSGLSVALAALLVLTGCAGASAEQTHAAAKQVVSIEIWTYYNGPQKVAFDALVSRYNETVGREQGIVVEAFSQGNVGELAQKVQNAAAKKVGSDQLPTIFATYADDAFAVDRQGLLASLDDYLTPEECAQYMDSYLEEGRFGVDNRLKIFPVAKSTEILMINASDWMPFSDETGVGLDELKTIEGVVRTAKRYYEWTDGKTPAPADGQAFFGRDAMANYLLVGSQQLGAPLFTIDASGKATVSVDKATMRHLWDCFYVPYVSGYFLSDGRFRSDDAKTGKVIAFQCSCTGATYFPDSVSIGDNAPYPVDSLVLMAPGFEGFPPITVQQGAGMAVVKSDPAHEGAAVQFLKWVTAQEQNVRFSVDSGYLPVMKSSNDTAVLNAALDATDGVSKHLKRALPVAMRQMKEQEHFFTKPFVGGGKARMLLEKSMTDRAVSDADLVRKACAEGASREEALAQMLTDENFDHWYVGFRTQLEEAVS